MLGYRAYEVQNREKDIKLAQVSLIIVFGELDKYYHVPKLMTDENICSVHILPQCEVDSKHLGVEAVTG